MPDGFGGFDSNPGEVAANLREFAQNGWVNIVGGCCGTNPDFIKAIAEAVAAAGIDIGTPVVYAPKAVELAGDRIAGTSIDDPNLSISARGYSQHTFALDVGAREQITDF